MMNITSFILLHEPGIKSLGFKNGSPGNLICPGDPFLSISLAELSVTATVIACATAAAMIIKTLVVRMVITAMVVA
jgi:hypothetical protein